MISAYIGYFRSGFHLVNKNIHIYYWSLLLLSIGYIDYLFKVLGIGPLPVFLSMVIFLIHAPFSFAFSLATTIFLNDSLEKRPVNFGYAFKTTFSLLRRLILYIPLGFILLMVLLLFFAVLTNTKFTQPNSLKTLMIPMSITTIIVGPLFIYTPIFFGIVKKSFLASLKESLRFALRNLSFTYFVLPYQIIMSSIAITIVNFYFYNSLLWLILAIIQYYLGLIITSGYLLYYKKINRIQVF